MKRKTESGDYRLTALVLTLVLTLCVTGAGAAVLNNNLVVSKVTLQITTTTAGTPALVTCPSGYSCMTDADAASQLGSYTKFSDAVCGYQQGAVTAVALIRVLQYCVKPVQANQPGCPGGCSCMAESMAKDKFQGNYKRCTDQPCLTAVTGAAQINYYCFGPGSETTTPAAVCPAECSCISEATAQAKGGIWTRCSETACGYEQSTATVAAVIQVPKYCMKLQPVTPVCPEGCVCITEAMAKERYGTYTRCSADACGIEQDQTPKYCIRQGSTPLCPEGCSCISEEKARAAGLTDRCDTGQKPCAYQTVDATANTAAQRIPFYCYKIPQSTPVPQTCDQGCYCLGVEEANLKFGPNGYTRCKADPCHVPSVTTANDVTKYCFKPLVTPTPAVCPQGCVCTTDEKAKIAGLTLCRGTRTSCGSTSDNQPLSCFEQIPSPTCYYDYQKNACTGTCPAGYNCGLLAQKKDETGKIVYGVCGCTGQPAGQCTFDSAKQACTGTCQSGGSCAIVGKKVDDRTGEVAVVCGCPPPATDPCSWDKEKQTCTGSCTTGASCSVIGKKADDAGNVYVFCGCPQPSSCVYDYSKDACAGTCPATGDACQLNTIYRDPASGKVTYAECHCKGGVPDTCAFNADHYCAGTCPQGGQCANTSVNDASGKITFVCTCAGGVSDCVLSANNECSGTCANQQPCTRIVVKDDSGQEKAGCGCGGAPQTSGTPAGTAARQPGLLEGFFSFFNRLFGGK